MIKDRLGPYLIANLYHFNVVAQHGSFSRAAAELNVTQAAVSQRIRQLEEQIGGRLFFRGAGGVSLTALGRDWHDAISEGFTMVSERTAALAERNQSSRLTVSCSPSLAMAWLIPRLRGFYARFPNFELNIVAEFCSPSREQMQRSGVDLAVRYDPLLEHPGLEVEDVCEEWIFPVMAPELSSRPASDEELVQLLERHPLLHDVEAWEGAPSTYEWDTWLAGAGLPPVIALNSRQYNFSYLALGAARQGDGIAMARALTVLDPIRRGALSALGKNPVPSGVWYRLISIPGSALAEDAASFCDWLRDEIGASQTEFQALLSRWNE